MRFDVSLGVALGLLACPISKKNGVAALTTNPTSFSLPAVGSQQSARQPFPLFSTRETVQEQEVMKGTKSSSKNMQAEVQDSEETVNDLLASSTAAIATPRSKLQTKSPLVDAAVALFPGSRRNNNSFEYQTGLITIGFITLLFSSNSPVLHAAFTQEAGTAAPPVLLLNAAVSVVALVGLLLGGETLEQNTDLPSSLQEQSTIREESKRKSEQARSLLALKGGCELGLWKFLGTTANIYGLSLTTAAHGAFFIQLTTLIVPVVQGLMGVPIPRRIQFSVVLALAGVLLFAQDPTGTPSAVGDLLCIVAAGFYATYDLRLFSWGKQVAPRRLITGKIATQALLSLGLLFSAGSTSTIFGSSLGVSELSAWDETMQYLSNNPQWSVLIPVVLWSGVAVNAIAPFLQVGGQQAVGPTRCQTIYASQPLWAALMSFFAFGETIGLEGLIGGSAFLTALFLAATAEAPDPDCDEPTCEV